MSHPAFATKPLLRLWAVALAWAIALSPVPVVAAQVPTPAAPTPDAMPSQPAPVVVEAPEGPQPFGANLFRGNFSRSRENGVNPDYIVMPGDRVSVATWGAIEINQTLVVDGQGNVFLPEIGPIPLAGVRNADLTSVVRAHVKRVYRRNFDVYTNLMTSNPVAVFVTGGVVQPGRYAGIPSDTILTFIDQAGGIDAARGSYRHIQVLRDGKSVADIDLYDFVLDGKLPSPQLEDNDTILVGRRGPVIELSGAVAGDTFVEFAGAQATGAEALRVVPKEARATEVTVTGMRDGAPFTETMSVAEFAKAQLQDGDRVSVRVDHRAQTILVHLAGEFEGPSVLAVRRGARLVDVLNHVPVSTETADTSAVHIRRASVAKAQKDAIHDSLFRLEKAALLALSGTVGESQIRTKEAELTQRFVERARLIEPLGRVVTADKGRQRNLLLEHGDVIVVPAQTNVVRVGGEVMMSQAVLLRDGMKAKRYIKMAGGYSRRADKRRVIIMHADASVELAKPNVIVRAGDEIIVPPKVDSKVFQGVLDVTTILYQLAIAAGTALRFFELGR